MDKLKILIVDDQLIGRQLLESILFREDYDLFFAEDGQEALDKIHDHQPDVVLLDVMMPQIDGFEVCKRVRNDEKIKDTPIILVTALDDRDSRLNGFQSGANDYISKPIDRLELLARVKNLTQMYRYKKQSDGVAVEQKVTKVVESPEGFIDQINQFLLQIEKDNLKKVFPDFFELIQGSDKKNLSAGLIHEENGLINLLYFQCDDYQYCSEGIILLNGLFPKAVHLQSEMGLKNAFKHLLEKLDIYFQERFQQSILEKGSLAWFNVNRMYHNFRYVSSNIDSRLFTENSEGILVKELKEENEFNISDRILIFPSESIKGIENIQSNSFSDLDSFISLLTESESEIIIAGFTLG